MPDPEPDADEVYAWGHDPHVHDDEHMFLYALLGHAVLWAPDQPIHLTPEVGAWIPAGVVHSARFDEDSVIVPFCFERDRFSLDADEVHVVRVAAHQRRHILAAARSSVGTPSDELFEVLQDSGSLLPLPAPQSAAPCAVAAGLRAVPHDQRTVEEWALALHTSASTLRRAFLAETGLTFSEWRTRARLNAAVELLAGGMLVGAVAARVGFTSTNGLILAFRRHFGSTPKAFARTIGA